MSKSVSRYKTNKHLNIYFNRNKIINNLEQQLSKEKRELKEIDKSINDMSYLNIKAPYSSLGFKERVQTSFISSYADISLERQTDNILKLQKEKQKEIKRLESELEKNQKIIDIMGFNVSILDNEQQNFLIERYGKNKSQQQLALEMYIDQANISRLQNKILRKLELIEKIRFKVYEKANL